MSISTPITAQNTAAMTQGIGEEQNPSATSGPREKRRRGMTFSETASPVEYSMDGRDELNDNVVGILDCVDSQVSTGMCTSTLLRT
jgi:hypothetical protein